MFGHHISERCVYINQNICLRDLSQISKELPEQFGDA